MEDLIRNNWRIILILIILLIFSLKKLPSSTNLLSTPSQRSSPSTLLQLYPDENAGIGRFIPQSHGIPNQFDGLKLSASELGLDSKLATYGSVSFDLDKDGYSDLIVAMEDGVRLYKNNLAGGQPFSSKLIMPKREGLTPFSIIVHDFDRDGNPDLYVRQFMDHNPAQEGPSVILRYLPSYEFLDVTHTVPQLKIKEILQLATNQISDAPVLSASQLVVKLPNTAEFVSARVVLVVGTNNHVKYNLVGSDLVQNSTLIFSLSPSDKIDKVKVRTIYGKEYNYDQQPLNTVLKVNTTPLFDATNNIWRSTSMG